MAVKRKKTPSVNDPVSRADAPVDPRVAEILQNLESEVEQRVMKIRAVATAAQSAIANHFKVQLLKLPKKVRSLPLTQFKEDFGGDIAAALLQDMVARLDGVSKATSSVPAETALKVQQNRGKLIETPAVACTTRKRNAITEGKENCWGDKVPTAARAPVMGEMAFSAQGSPLGRFEQEAAMERPVLNTLLKGGTMLKTPMPGALSQPPFGGAIATIIRKDGPGSKCGVADAIVVTTKDGTQISVDLEGGLAAVPAKQRKEVQAQLEAMRRLAESALGKTAVKR